MAGFHSWCSGYEGYPSLDTISLSNIFSGSVTMYSDNNKLWNYALILGWI